MASLESIGRENTQLKPEIEHQARKAFELLQEKSWENSNMMTQDKMHRGYIDGAFDLVHSGHFNAIRQAKALNHHLVAGPNTDSAIEAAKGPTILKEVERAAIISAVKWVDETCYNSPYDVDEAQLDKVNCQFYVHGDDPVYNAAGENMNEVLGALNRFKMIKRTTGISTTDITGRLLKLLEPDTDEDGPSTSTSKGSGNSKFTEPPKQQFLQTSTRISNFSNKSDPKPGDTIVYFAASCDLMHPGVIERLRLAKEQGDYLYVGLWDDEMIRYYKGAKYPLQSLQERILMALAIQYVDDVVIGAPYIVTEDLIRSLNISKVVYVNTAEDQVKEEYKTVDPYTVPKEQKIFVEIPKIENDLTLEDIAKRVAANREAFEKKFNKKKSSQDDYYKNKKSMSEASPISINNGSTKSKGSNNESPRFAMGDVPQ